MQREHAGMQTGLQTGTPACAEMDVFEANQAAIQATMHTESGSDWKSDGSCNRAGCYVNWGNSGLRHLSVCYNQVW